VCRKIESWLIRGNIELPTVVFDEPQLAQELNWENGTLSFLSMCESVGKPAKMLRRRTM
jgi:hypothetical protein